MYSKYTNTDYAKKKLKKNKYMDARQKLKTTMKSIKLLCVGKQGKYQNTIFYL